MKWFNNLRVSMKVLLSCAVMLILISLMSILGVITLKKSNSDFDTFYDDRFICILQLNSVAKDLLQIHINMTQVLLNAETNNWKLVNERMENTKKLADEYAGIWKDYKATYLTDEEKALAAEWEKNVEKPKGIRDDFQKAIEARDLKTSQRLLDQWQAAYQPLQDQTGKLIDLQARVGKNIKVELDAGSSQQVKVNIIILLAAIAMGAIITMILSRAVSRPVGKGLAFAESLADGDLTQRIDLDQKDELGQLGSALNRAADNLEQMISNVMAGSQNLAQAVEQISSGNQNLSQRTNEQASSLEEIASTIEETTATINMNAENAERAKELTDTGVSKSVDGNRVALEAVASINEMNESSKKVADIISTINEIAFQTNLLALNAAVEAARAGEQGRGFAVVAGEVRNLAQRSGNAAKEIEVLIKDTVNKVDRGTELVNRTGTSLNEIAEAAKTSAQIIAEIAAASIEQKQGINQINNAISEMDSMTQQNASLVEETASASEEMANQAQDLLAMVQKFKIDGNLKGKTNTLKHREIHLKAIEVAERISVKKIDDGKGKMRAVHSAPAKSGESDKVKDIMQKEGFEEY